jgi:phosphoribosylanthranilate isomerase
MNRMFRVKICGITNVEDANAAVEAGADAIGLNFYEKSPRCLSVDIARGIVIRSRARNSVQWVGVFVNNSDVHRTARLAGVGWVQLHGDEPPEAVGNIRDWLNVIRARKFDDNGVAGLAKDIADCRANRRGPTALLVDSATPGRYGGTGETVSWVGLADHKRWLGDTPLILAGGLTPDNVAEAIRIVRPAAVDVASGVETAPGKKDSAKVRDFVANALGAFEALGR